MLQRRVGPRPRRPWCCSAGCSTAPPPRRPAWRGRASRTADLLGHRPRDGRRGGRRPAGPGRAGQGDHGRRPLPRRPRGRGRPGAGAPGVVHQPAAFPGAPGRPPGARSRGDPGRGASVSAGREVGATAAPSWSRVAASSAATVTSHRMSPGPATTTERGLGRAVRPGGRAHVNGTSAIGHSAPSTSDTRVGPCRVGRGQLGGVQRLVVRHARARRGPHHDVADAARRVLPGRVEHAALRPPPHGPGR